MSTGKRFAVVDFETTGLSPDRGARITEVAVVLVEAGLVVDRYQSLVKTGAWIPAEIERLTGISNDMVASAPDAVTVMRAVHKFAACAVPVAHNASFDKKFWNAEMHLAGQASRNDFLCTMLLSRRLYPGALNHKLDTLAQFHALKRTGSSHRALSDAELTAQLFLRICADAKDQFKLAHISPASLLAVQNNS